MVTNNSKHTEFLSRSKGLRGFLYLIFSTSTPTPHTPETANVTVVSQAASPTKPSCLNANELSHLPWSQHISAYSDYPPPHRYASLNTPILIAQQSLPASLFAAAIPAANSYTSASAGLGVLLYSSNMRTWRSWHKRDISSRRRSLLASPALLSVVQSGQRQTNLPADPRRWSP